MMRKVIIFLVILLFSGIACLPYCEKPKPTVKEDELGIDSFTKEATSEVRTPSPREAVFLYKDSERPLMSYEGGPRVTGIISGQEPMAIFEIAGQGFVVKVEDKICGYKVKAIDSKIMALTKAGRNYWLKLE